MCSQHVHDTPFDAQVVSTMAELFSFIKGANAVLDRPVGPELGAGTPRVLLEPVRSTDSLARKTCNLDERL